MRYMAVPPALPIDFWYTATSMSFKQLCVEWIDAPVELCWYVMGYVGFQPRIAKVLPSRPSKDVIIDSDHVLLIDGMDYSGPVPMCPVTVVNVHTGKELKHMAENTINGVDGEGTWLGLGVKIMRDMKEPLGAVDETQYDKKLIDSETPIAYTWSYDTITYIDRDDKFYVGVLDDVVPMYEDRCDTESLLPIQWYDIACACNRHVMFIGSNVGTPEGRKVDGVFVNITTKEQWPLNIVVQTVGSIDGTMIFEKEDEYYYYAMDDRRLRRLPPTPTIGQQLALYKSTREITRMERRAESRFGDLRTRVMAGIYDGILRRMIAVVRNHAFS